MNWSFYAAVGIGGAAGSIARYIFVTVVNRMFDVTFPWGTLGVNVAGSVVMGVLVGLFAQALPVSPLVRTLLLVGVLGGFTTFSSFSLDVVALIDRGDFGLTALYILSSVLVSVVGLMLGRYLIMAATA
jgi:CrcB protein